MASSHRRASLSPSERQRTKSQSSSRSHRTPPNIVVHEDDVQQERLLLPASRRNTREAISTKRSESSTSNRSTTVTSPTSNVSKKPRASLKSSTPPITADRRGNTKRKKSTISIAESEKKQLAEANDSEKQDLSARGLLVIPAEIFERKSTHSPPSLENLSLTSFPSFDSSTLDFIKQ